jgi:hypothetical protein
MDYTDKYAEFIMNNCRGDRVICNGKTLLDAMEDFYLWEEFCRSEKIDPDTEF